ncbi:MAG TPA: hypothetical protein PLN94_15000, partial [Thiolinea sp.]|nr:hypothetical protein [Thiolinea sp.]
MASGTLLFLPAAWAGHLANLAQRVPANCGNGGGETVIWFPLSGILVRLMLALAAGFILTGWAIGFSGERVATLFAQIMGEAAKTNSDLAAPAPADLERSGQLYAALVPVVIPAIWLMMHVLVMHFAAVVVNRSGRLARPADD